jgi:pimeloyl-ACP methyl ester carboxylesterase
MTVDEIVVGRYVSVEGVRVYFESGGLGDGPVMLCLHTAGRDGRQWQDYIHHYGDRYRVLAPDLPGHPKSWPMPGSRCLDDPDEMTAFLWSFLDAVAPGQAAVLVGCSMGGNLVFSMAQARPTQVRALVSLEGTDTVGRPVAPFDLLAHPAVGVADWYYERIDGLIGTATSPDRRSFIHWTARQLIAETQAADLGAYSRFDASAGMDQITCPSLLIHGTDDWIVTESMVRSAADHLVNASSVTVHELPGAGHFAHVELPEECCALMDAFFTEVGLPAGGGAAGNPV